MTNRITQSDLESAVAILNQNSKRQYRLDYAYGKTKLVVLLPNSSAIRDVTHFATKPQVWDMIHAILTYLSEEKHEVKT